MQELAEDRLCTAINAFQSFGMNAEVLDCLEDCAALVRMRGDAAGAVRLYATIENGRSMLAVPRRPRGAASWEGALLAARAALGDAAFDAAWASGTNCLLEQAIGEFVARREARELVTT